jgi:hypothetical protein
VELVTQFATCSPNQIDSGKAHRATTCRRWPDIEIPIQ